jgi:hypothetical protein
MDEKSLIVWCAFHLHHKQSSPAECWPFLSRGIFTLNFTQLSPLLCFFQYLAIVLMLALLLLLWACLMFSSFIFHCVCFPCPILLNTVELFIVLCFLCLCGSV